VSSEESASSFGMNMRESLIATVLGGTDPTGPSPVVLMQVQPQSTQTMLMEPYMFGPEGGSRCKATHSPTRLARLLLCRAGYYDSHDHGQEGHLSSAGYYDSHDHGQEGHFSAVQVIMILMIMVRRVTWVRRVMIMIMVRRVT
jgi:hypothetical protein